MVTHNPILHDLLHEVHDLIREVHDLLKFEFEHRVPHKGALEASFVPTHVNKLILIVRYKYMDIIF